MTAILLGLLTGGLSAASWEGVSRFSLGAEYNSSLYEFEPLKVSTTFSAFKVSGQYSRGGQFLSYYFSILDPWKKSDAGHPPSRMVYGSLDYRNIFRLGPQWTLEASARYQARDAKNKPVKYAVEEDPYTLYGAEAVLHWRERVRVTLGWGVLDPQDYGVFAYKRTVATVQADAWRGGKSRFYAALGGSWYDFDQKILVVPDMASGSGFPPLPTFQTHRDTSKTMSAGWEFTGSVLLNLRAFYRDTDSTIRDFSSTGWGLDMTLSASPAPQWTVVAGARYEDRRLAKSYLLFDPSILTEAGTNYLVLRIRRVLKPDVDLELDLGRYVHDVRQSFFDAPKPRHKASLSVIVSL